MKSFTQKLDQTVKKRIEIIIILDTIKPINKNFENFENQI
jgi:hypothetical protein